MQPDSFCYWLQGFFEISDPATLDATQVQIIKDHLAEVFHKVTPDRRKSGQDNKAELLEWIKTFEDKEKVNIADLTCHKNNEDEQESNFHIGRSGYC